MRVSCRWPVLILRHPLPRKTRVDYSDHQDVVKGLANAKRRTSECLSSNVSAYAFTNTAGDSTDLHRHPNEPSYTVKSPCVLVACAGLEPSRLSAIYCIYVSCLPGAPARTVRPGLAHVPVVLNIIQKLYSSFFAAWAYKSKQLSRFE